MRPKAFDSTLSRRDVEGEPPYTCELYSLQGRIRPLYRASNCVWERKPRSLYSTPRFMEAVIARDLMRIFP